MQRTGMCWLIWVCIKFSLFPAARWLPGAGPAAKRTRTRNIPTYVRACVHWDPLAPQGPGCNPTPLWGAVRRMLPGGAGRCVTVGVRRMALLFVLRFVLRPRSGLVRGAGAKPTARPRSQPRGREAARPEATDHGRLRFLLLARGLRGRRGRQAARGPTPLQRR